MSRSPRQLSKKNSEIAIEIAPYWQRACAFILDVVLVSALASLCLNKFILPEKFPGALDAMTLYVQQLAQAVQSKTSIEEIKVAPNVQEAAVFVQAFLYFLFWTYFASSEILLKGSSLGKRVFRLQVVNMYTAKPLGLFEVLVRSGIKGLTLLTYFPILAIDYIVPLFNSQRQSLHDMLSRSLVIVQTKEDEDEEDEELEEDEESF